MNFEEKSALLFASLTYSLRTNLDLQFGEVFHGYMASYHLGFWLGLC